MSHPVEVSLQTSLFTFVKTQLGVESKGLGRVRLRFRLSDISSSKMGPHYANWISTINRFPSMFLLIVAQIYYSSLRVIMLSAIRSPPQAPASYFRSKTEINTTSSTSVKHLPDYKVWFHLYSDSVKSE